MINSFSYAAIKAEIDKKLNSKLVEHFHLFGHQQTSLDKWIAYDHNQLIRRRKKHERLDKLELYQEIFDPFEEVSRPLGKTK